jgi:hypothetical protein
LAGRIFVGIKIIMAPVQSIIKKAINILEVQVIECIIEKICSIFCADKKNTVASSSSGLLNMRVF